jgi:hypothetical protein
MFQRQGTKRIRWAIATAATLTSLVASVLIAGPAQASSSATDGFEGNPYDRWTEDEVRGFSIVELTNHRRARNGANIAWLEAYPPSVHSARIYRTVTVDPPLGGPAWCYGEAYVMRSNIQLARPENVRVTLQIRAGGPSGARLSGTAYELTPDHETSYAWLNFASFAYQPGPLTIDISARSGTVLVDDVSLWCNQEIR